MRILLAYIQVGREGEVRWKRGRREREGRNGGKESVRKPRRVCRWQPQMGTGRER